MRRVFICLSVFVTLPSLAAPVEPPGPRKLRSRGRQISWNKVAQRVRKARLVYVGEEHGKSEHHRLQRDILAIMSRAGPTVLGVEYFARSHQPVLDRFHKGQISLADFPKAIGWDRIWGHSYASYEPLFRLCKERNIRIVALNAERSVVKRVRRKGFKEGFKVEELLMLPRIDLTNEAHRKRVHKALLKVHPMPEALLRRFYQAFTLWDESMAAATAEILLKDRRDNLRVLVLAGRAHISHGTGVPDRVSRRITLPRLTVLCDSSGKAGPEVADIVYDSSKKRQPKLY
jgi:uncharacterized iron-regulated protein